MGFLLSVFLFSLEPPPYLYGKVSVVAVSKMSARISSRPGNYNLSCGNVSFSGRLLF